MKKEYSIIEFLEETLKNIHADLSIGELLIYLRHWKLQNPEDFKFNIQEVIGK